MFESKTELEVAEEVANFFNTISDEFDPITPLCLPPDESWMLENYEVADMLRSSKKPKSRADGDIFPDLISPNSDILR